MRRRWIIKLYKNAWPSPISHHRERRDHVKIYLIIMKLRKKNAGVVHNNVVYEICIYIYIYYTVFKHPANTGAMFSFFFPSFFFLSVIIFLQLIISTSRVPDDLHKTRITTQRRDSLISYYYYPYHEIGSRSIL